MDYKSKIVIDESRLPAEWVGQASLFMELIEAEAEANKQVDLLKESLEVVEAQESDTIRSHYESNGKKLTEVALSQQLVQSSVIQKAKAELRKAVYQQDIVSGARKALEHRKSALEHLVMMQLRLNRSEPVVAGTSSKSITDAMAQQRMDAHPVKGPERKTEW